MTYVTELECREYFPLVEQHLEELLRVWSERFARDGPLAREGPQGPGVGLEAPSAVRWRAWGAA